MLTKQPATKAAQIAALAQQRVGNILNRRARRLTDTDMRNRTLAELQMVKNGIYTCHSHIFGNAEIKKDFSLQPCYTPKHRVGWTMLSKIEKQPSG